MKDRIMKRVLSVLLVVVLMGLAACSPKTAESNETPKEDTAKTESTEAESGESVDTSQVSNGASWTNPTEPGDGNRIYFAAPLFNDAERDYNLKIVTILENYGYEVFLPQRDGFLAPDLEGLTGEEKIVKIFEKDRDEVLNADIFFMLLDGRVIDEGACAELGMAYIAGKRCYGFKNDARTLEADLEMNPLIEGAFLKMFNDMDGEALSQSLEDYLKENQL